MRSNADYDVIIIGARAAGSTLASVLGEKGHRVLIIDRSRFPSDTLSTHFFRAPALRAFDKIGVLDEVLRSAPHLTVNYNVVDEIEFPEPVDRPDDFPFYMCVRRIILDDILTRHVKQIPDVEFREGTRVKGLIRDNDIVKGVVWETSGQSGEATAKAVIGADGINSFMAKEVDAKTEKEVPVNRAMYFAYYNGIPPKEGPAAEFHYRGNTLAYCFPCDSDLTLVAVSIPLTDFPAFKRNPETEFKNLLNKMPMLAPRLNSAVREGQIKGSGSIPGYLRLPYGKGWALVGDAAMVMDPWSGQGIDQATTHALLLATQLDNYLSGNNDWESAMKSYHSERNEFSLKTWQRTSSFSVDFRPMIKEALKRRGLA